MFLLEIVFGLILIFLLAFVIINVMTIIFEWIDPAFGEPTLVEILKNRWKFYVCLSKRIK